MIALETGQTDNGSEWELLFVHKDGHVNNDGTLTLPAGEKAVLRKICTNEQLQKTATLHDFVEWRPCVLEERPDERVLQLRDELSHTEHNFEETDKQLQEIKEKYEVATKELEEAKAKIKDLTTLNQKRRERAAWQEVDQRIRTTATEIEARTPSQTQKIIANQVELGAGFYQEVGVQSHESFRLSVWLALAGGGIFLLTVLAAISITWLRGDSAPITWIGSIAAALTEGLAAGNRLYNQASRQFAAFQVDLDRINRSSISYAMISEEAFEKKTEEQRDAILKVVDTLSDHRK
jgi:septal ring factor EnvC (AmiA/AmiB activator)